MLQAMRRNSRHAIIYVLFGILIAAFVISFGPGSRGFGYSGVSSAYAAKVAGSTVSEQDFHFAYVALGGTQYPPQVARERRLKEFVMDRLIERELFATEARAARLRRLEQGSRGSDLRRQDDRHGRPAPRRQLRLQGRQVRLRPLQDGVAEPARRHRAALHRDPEARDARRQGARSAARLVEGRRPTRSSRSSSRAGCRSTSSTRAFPSAATKRRSARPRRRRSTPTSRRTRPS